MPPVMIFTQSTTKKKPTKPTKPKNSLAALNDSLSSSTKKKIAKIASLTRKRRTRLLKRLVKNFKTKQETKKKAKKAATTIQVRARAKFLGQKTREQIKENYKIDNQCAICFDTMKDNGRTTKTKCGHKFHSECIDRWLTDYNNNNTCPTCREILVERDTDDEEDEEEEEEEEDPALDAEYDRINAEAQALGRSRATESINLIRSNYAAALRNLESIDNSRFARAWRQAALSADSRFAMAWRQAALSAVRDVHMKMEELLLQCHSAWAVVRQARSIALADLSLGPEGLRWSALEGLPAASEADEAYYKYRWYAMDMMKDLLNRTITVFSYEQLEDVMGRMDDLFDGYLRRLTSGRFDLRQEVRNSAMRMAKPYV